MSDRAHNQSWYDRVKKNWPYLLMGILLVGALYKFYVSDKTISGSPFAIDAGEEQSLPLVVVNLKKLAVAYRIKNFAMSKSFIDDAWINATVREYTYPIKYLKESNFYFSLEGEGAPAYCQKIGIGKKVILYEC